ncbi:MAG TPA: type II secretion system protein [Ramlibacter sp.]|uniref:type II secretion system protein n=1 Tax=Ramlibacter sp. TaxID=1917967 RepID=UPI002ED687FC
MRGSRRGFTLIELLVVMAIIATLLALAAPRFFNSADNAREVALRHDLATLREAIDRHFADTGRYPDSLEDLAARKYVRSVVPDPITDSSKTWIPVPPENRELGAMADVRSGAPGKARDGSAYKDW